MQKMLSKNTHIERDLSISELSGNVADFDLDNGHAGVLLQDNSILNFDLLTRPENGRLTILETPDGSKSGLDIGRIQQVHSGDGFNLLVTDQHQVYAQPVRRGWTRRLSAAMAQPLGWDNSRHLYKVDMVSDYNSLQGTQVSRPKCRCAKLEWSANRVWCWFRTGPCWPGETT